MGETLPEALASERYSPGNKGQLRAAVFGRFLGDGCILGCMDCSEVAWRVLDAPLIEVDWRACNIRRNAQRKHARTTRGRWRSNEQGSGKLQGDVAGRVALR